MLRHILHAGTPIQRLVALLVANVLSLGLLTLVSFAMSYLNSVDETHFLFVPLLLLGLVAFAATLTSLAMTFVTLFID